MTVGPLVIDTSALLAMLFAEPDALAYAQLPQSAASPRTTALTWMEAMQVATARRGSVGSKGLEEPPDLLNVAIVVRDAVLARLAYQAWLRLGEERRPAGLNFGDCFSYAPAKQRGDPLLFKGDDVGQTDVIAAG